MAIVKITEKQLLDELVAKITLRLGKKPTQQDVLDLCVSLGKEHFEELVSKLTDVPVLDDTRIKEIEEIRNNLSDIEFSSIENANFSRKDDKEIYSV